MNPSVGGAAPRSMSPRRVRVLMVALVIALLVAATIGVPFSGGGTPTDHVHLVDLSRSCSADPSRLIDALAARLLPGDPDDRVAIVGFGDAALTLAPLRPADDPDSALGAARARLASLPVASRGASRLEAGVARARSLSQDPNRRLVVTVWGDLRYPPGQLLELRRALPAHARLEVRGRLVDPEPGVRLGLAGVPPRLEPGHPAIVRVLVHLQDDRPRTATLSAGGRSFVVHLRPGRPEVVAVNVTPGAGATSVRVAVTEHGGADVDPLNDAVTLPVVDQRRQRVVVIGDGRVELSPSNYEVRRVASPERRESIDPASVIILADQPATEGFRSAWSELLRRHVTRDGSGLVVLGGRNAFRCGGYGGWELDALLPLSSRPARGRDVHVLLDRSGSMEQDDRLQRAIEALRHLARGLATSDRIQVWPFGVDALPPVPASPASPDAFVRSALAELWRLVPTGGTRLVGAFEGPGRAAGASDDRETILVVLSDLKDDRLDATALRSLKGDVARFSGGAVGLVLDPTPKTTRTARALGLAVVPVRELTPDVFLAQVEGDGWKTASLETVWTNPPAGVPQASSIRGWNPVLRGEGSRVLLETSDGQPLLGDVRRGAGRIMALATDPGLEGWTRGLVRLLVDAVARPDTGAWSAHASSDGMVVLSADGVAGPLTAAWPSGGRVVQVPLVEVTAGAWHTSTVPEPVALRILGPEGELLARPALALPDDPEYLVAPLPVPAPVAAPGRAPSRSVRWPPAALALVLMAGLVLLRHR